MDYQKAYALLVGSISSAIDELNKSAVFSLETERAIKLLKDALETVEEMYIAAY